MRKPLFGSFKNVNHSILMTRKTHKVIYLLNKFINRELTAIGLLTFHSGVVFSTLMSWVWAPPQYIEVYYTVIVLYSIFTIIFGLFYDQQRSKRAKFVNDLGTVVNQINGN